MIDVVTCTFKKFFTQRFTAVRYKQRIIPGWNNNVKSLHADARAAYVIWLSNGKSNAGLMYGRMISSRKKV